MGPGELSSAGVRDEPGAPSFLALRTAHRSYVEYVTGEREPHDRDTDTQQLHNLALERAYAAEVTRFHAWLEAFRACSGKGCQAVESQVPD